MKSQVSFRYSGSHNTPFIKQILRSELKEARFLVEETGYNIYRIYVASKNEREKVFNACYGIQCFCVYDNNRELH